MILLDLKDIRENPIWATKDELEKQRMIEKAYKKMNSGAPMTKDEDEALSEYMKIMKDMNKTKTSVDANKSLSAPGRKYASAIFGMSNSSEGSSNRRINSAYTSNMPMVATEPAKEEPDFQQAMMASLMKDTPEGVFQNAQARILAENKAVKDNYIRAYSGLRNESNKTFDMLMKSDPEISHPDVAPDAVNYFSILRDYSPAMARNPVVLKSFIMKARTYGGIDPKELTGLIQTNNEYMKHATNL